MTKNNLKLVLIALGVFSLSGGLWYNFQSLWLQDNGLSITTISTVTSLSSLGCVSAMLIFFDLITKNRLKNFITILLFIKVLILGALFFLNGTDLHIPIKLLIMFDIIIETEIKISIYPLLTLFQKDDKLYCKKDLIISSFYDIGILIGAFFLGRKIFDFDITFNVFLLLSLIFVFMTLVIINRLQVENVDKSPPKDIFRTLMSSIKKDKISKFYLSYLFFGNMSFYTVTGLKMIFLTSILSMNANSASNYILVISIVSDVVGIMILRRFTFKNNYLNIFIKFGGRFVFYVLSALTGNVYVYLFALSYALLFSNSYSHVTEAPYFNRYSSDYQLAFCNIRNMVSYFSQAVGISICGFAFVNGMRYMFLIASIFVLLQIILAIYTYKLKKLEDIEKQDSFVTLPLIKNN